MISVVWAGPHSPIVGDAELHGAAEEAQIMVMPAIIRPVTTIEELLALPEDGFRHELLDGEHVVTPAPALPHQDILMRLIERFLPSVRGRNDLRLYTSPADIVLGPRSLVQPDLFVIRIDPASPPSRWNEVGVPELAIEILSPSTASRDRGKKRRIYQRAGVAEYWIVDQDARLIERWRPEDLRPEVVDETLVWEWDGAAQATVKVPELFQP
jgi:Uma2 family endonuclease